MIEDLQDYQKYIDQKKELYEELLSFLEDSQVDEIEVDNFIENLKNGEQEINREELYNFLQLIKNIANNHCRKEHFNDKIKKIIQSFKDEIIQAFTNTEIYNIFKSNKLVLLFLIESKIIKFNDYIYTEMMQKNLLNNEKYYLYFYPEIKSFIGDEKSTNIKQELLDIDQDILDNFDENRHKGENDLYISSLIREDSVEEFIIYVTKNVYNLSNKIKHSIFETNPFLIDKTPTLIEYAAFFGSIQIFQYLRLNKVELTETLWLYVIHSNNAEMIHILEEDRVPINEIFESCMIESIKCHHNNIANYLKDTQNFDLSFENCEELIDSDLNFENLDELLISYSNNENLKDKIDSLLNMNNLRDKVFSAIFKYSNYSFFTYEIDRRKNKQNHVFFYLCLNNYHNLVNLYLKTKKEEIDRIIKEIFTKFNSI